MHVISLLSLMIGSSKVKFAYSTWKINSISFAYKETCNNIHSTLRIYLFNGILGLICDVFPHYYFKY